jgi:hypothetical protein
MWFLVRAWAALLSGLVFFAAAAAYADPVPTFSEAGARAAHDLVSAFYTGDGKWRTCNREECATLNSDWGADAATYALYLRWTQSHDASVASLLSQLTATSPRYGEPCRNGPCPNWSDTPAWDAVAALREYEVSHDQQALANAQAALAYVQTSTAFFRGACPDIPYQHPPQDASHVKTLETTANAVKADLLAYKATNDATYLKAARDGYDSARRYYLDPQLPLYTVHVVDDGVTCSQVPHRFFASVNGDMIWNGIELWRLTGETHYINEALATANAVDNNLGDNRGIFANLQGENDVEEPLVEAMLDLAQREHLAFAQEWLLRNASAALGARARDGSFSRFFDGPPQGTTSIWETNGGASLEIAAATIAPQMPAVANNGWAPGRDVSVNITSLPATITVDGSGVALVGTMTRLCEHGHVRVLIDGVQTTDHTGLWQNPSMPSGPSVLFAWRWAEPGHHTITLEPGDSDAATPNAISLQGFVLN